MWVILLFKFTTTIKVGSSCSIFKLHPGTFSFSIISEIFQAIFINSESHEINCENAGSVYTLQSGNFIHFSWVSRQMWSQRSFYHHLNGFSSIPWIVNKDQYTILTLFKVLYTYLCFQYLHESNHSESNECYCQLPFWCIHAFMLYDNTN